MTDQTIITNIIQIITNHPIQTGIVLFLGAWLIGLIRLELSKY